MLYLVNNLLHTSLMLLHNIQGHVTYLIVSGGSLYNSLEDKFGKLIDVLDNRYSINNGFIICNIPGKTN